MYIIFEKNKIILIDIFYKNISKKDFENFLNPRMIPIIFYYKKKYPNFELEIQYFSDEKIAHEFEKKFLEKLEII